MTFYTRLQKFNPNHEPAGSEKGGQFASSGGISIGAAIADQLHQFFLMQGIDLTPKAKDEVTKFFSEKTIKEFSDLPPEYSGPQVFAALAAKTFSPLLAQPEAVQLLNGLSAESKKAMAETLGGYFSPPGPPPKWKLDNFEKIGLYVGDDKPMFLKAYNKTFPDTDPADLVAMFKGWPNASDKPPFDGVFMITRTEDGEGVSIRRRIGGSSGSGEDNRADREFRRKGGKLVVDHSVFTLDPADRGYGKTFLRQSMAAYKKMGVSSITLHANIDVGGYAWARYGFTPDKDSWERLKEDLGSFAQYQPKTAKWNHARKLLKEDDPRAIWELADIPTLGKRLLLKSDWTGGLNLKDKDAMRRFTTYVGQ